MTQNQSIALKVASILWIIWGIVHVIAFVAIFMADGASGAVQAVADAVPPSELEFTAHPAAKALYNQHGWNLGWVGATTLICAFFIWNGNRTAIWVAALTGGLADVGYFVFMDLGGYVNFVPGGMMTYVSASAILLSGWVWFGTRKG